MAAANGATVPMADALGAWIAAFSLDAEPARDMLVREAKAHILDGIGIALAASTAQDGFPALVRSVVDGFGSSGSAQLIASHDRAAPALAALYNGALMHAVEFDDTHMERLLHSEPFAVSAALAVGEDLDASGVRVAEAWCLGTETALRLLAACDPHVGLTELGFQNAGVFGTFGAATVAARLHGLDAEQTADALSTCTSFASGTTAGWGQRSGRAKCVQPGWAAFSGITATNLARAGLTCGRTIDDTRVGLYVAHLRGESWTPEAVLDGLGEHWKLEGITYKMHPGGVMLQAALDVTQEIVHETGLQPDEVQEIEITVPHQYAVLMEHTRYFDSTDDLTDGFMLTHSWPYSVACTLLFGQLGVEHLRDEIVTDPRVRALVARIRCTLSPDAATPPLDQPTAIRVRTARGEFRASRARHLGYPEHVTLDRVVAKFERNARLALPAANVDRLRDLVLDLETAGAREIAAACRP